MTICPDCGAETWEPGDPYDGIGQPVRLGGERHRSTCPRIPQLSAEERQRLQEDLDEMGRVRRRAEAESRNIWIG